jgi:hypothetical protein
MLNRESRFSSLAPVFTPSKQSARAKIFHFVFDRFVCRLNERAPQPARQLADDRAGHDQRHASDDYDHDVQCSIFHL